MGLGLFPAGDDIIAPITYPNQINGAGDINALAISEYAGHVEGTLERKSVLADMIPRRRVVGTNKVHNWAVGETTLSVLEPGKAPDAGGADFNKSELTVDTVIVARNVLPLLSVFQQSFDARREIGVEHGKKIAKFTDQAFFIQAAKTAALANPVATGTDGHLGGTTVTLDNALDVSDPAKMYRAVSNLNVAMAEKDVDWVSDDIMLAFRPAVYAALRDAEQIINGTYRTADGTEREGMIYKAFGAPVVQSNNVPNSNISGHYLSNTANSNAYDGDFTKLAGLAFSPRALLAGETIPLESDVFYDKIYKMWFVDSHMSFGVAPNRAEFAGRIVLP
jgi:hypothetical protein